MITRASALARLHQLLPPMGVEHCLAVSGEAQRLAAVFGVSEEAARWAGLLHDCARGLSAVQSLRQARARGMRLYLPERMRPLLLHQRLGARWASERFGVDAPSVLAAIRCHTTGAASMDPLARCVMIADRVSPDRSPEQTGPLRRALRRGPEAAFRAVLLDKQRGVAGCGSPDHPWALAAYNRYL